MTDKPIAHQQNMSLTRNELLVALKSVEVQCLPPTSGAAKYHSYRIYYQTQVWMGNISLRTEDWEWKINCGSLLPCIMGKKPAPDALLTIIRCKCKGYCDSLYCSTKKLGLYCTDFCAECQDGVCVNVPLDEDDEG